MRQSVALQALPGGAAVARTIHRAPWPSAEHAVGVHLDLPHAREKNAWIVRIHHQSAAAGVRIGEQHALPILAAIGASINTALLLRTSKATQRAREHDIGITGMNNHASDAPGVVETQVRPG